MTRDPTAGIRPAGTSRTWGIVLVVAITVSAIAVGGGIATALQEDKPDPNLPAMYYGNVDIDGGSAPVGTTITAEIDGEQRGSTTVEEAGEYGFSVRGTANEAGKPITFLVNGEEVTADETPVFDPGSASEVNLTGESVDSLPASGPDPKSTEPVLEVVDGNVSAETVRVGERLHVAATVENVGGDGTTGTVEVSVDGTVETTRTVTLEGGATEDVTGELTFDETGTYEIAVGEREVGTVTVRDRAPAEFAVEDAQVGATEIAVGESVDVTATVRNADGASETGTVELVVGGSVAATETVTLEANGTETVSFTESFESPGEYDVAVGDARAGTVTVTGDETIPGFGAAAAIAALAATLVVLRRRYRSTGRCRSLPTARLRIPG